MRLSHWRAEGSLAADSLASASPAAPTHFNLITPLNSPSPRGSQSQAGVSPHDKAWPILLSLWGLAHLLPAAGQEAGRAPDGRLWGDAVERRRALDGVGNRYPLLATQRTVSSFSLGAKWRGMGWGNDQN